MKLDLGTIVIIKKEQTFTENYFDWEITYMIRKGEEGVVCDYDERGVFVEFEANEDHPQVVVSYMMDDFIITDRKAWWCTKSLWI